MQPEAKLTKAIRKLITDKGGRPFKIQGMDESFQEVGIPDLLVCYLGYFIGAEVKLPGARLRATQRVTLDEIFRAGGVAAVLETVGQAALLLQHLEKRGFHETGPNNARGVCFDRGIVRSVCKWQ